MAFGSVTQRLNDNKKWYIKKMLSQYKISKATVIYFTISGFCPHPKLTFSIQRMRGKDKIKEKITKQDTEALLYTTQNPNIKLYQLPNFE